MSQTQPNSIAEWGFVSKLGGKKKINSGERERHFSGQCTKHTEASWTQIKYAVFTLLSDRTNALYSLVFLPMSLAAKYCSLIYRMPDGSDIIY